jgi:MHS family alpha-ketoglutarate permease-like MFS transporter
MIVFGICGTLFTYPIFATLAHADHVAPAFALVMAGLVMLTGYTSINAIVKAELFPADIRALGVALPYAIANTLFGGTAEYVALWLKDAGHEAWFYIYISSLSAIYLICVLRMRETQATSRILED